MEIERYSLSQSFISIYLELLMFDWFEQFPWVPYLLFGAVLGWVVEWIVDVVWWRRSRESGPLLKVKKELDTVIQQLTVKEDQYDGIELVRNHNRHQADLKNEKSQDRGSSRLHHVAGILNAFGDDVDEFLRKRKRNRLKQQQQLGR